MKLLLITDQHFGYNSSQVFLDYYKDFYHGTVMPYIDHNKIDMVICLGDSFDKRKNINISVLMEAKNMWFSQLAEREIRMPMLVGNHDSYYKNNLFVNSPKILLEQEYHENIIVFDRPVEIFPPKYSFLMLPWICDDNRKITMQRIENSNARFVFGHLELDGFPMYRDIYCLLYTSPSPRDRTRSRMPSSA